MELSRTLYCLAISCCIFVTVIFIFLIIKWLFDRGTYNKENIAQQKSNVFLYWVQKTEKRLKKQKLIYGKFYILTIIALSGLAFLGCLVVFRNFPAAFFVSLTILLIPGRILQIFEEKRRLKLTEQLLIAIRFFTAEFIQTPQLEKGFAAIGARVPAPIGTLFSNAYGDLVIGTEPELVLADLSAKLETEHGKMFVQLLRQARIDASIVVLFPKLIGKVEEHLDLLKENTSGLSGERILTILAAVAPVPIYFILRGIIPEVDSFFIETFIGKLLFAAVFLSMFLWALIDKVIGGVQT